MSRLIALSFGLVSMLALVPAHADDLTGADHLVCAATTVVACSESGECEEGVPAELNVPRFIEVELNAKLLHTTRASGQNRSTPITTIIRDAGMIVLQGYEAGRAFSFVISEKDGSASVAVARDGLGVAVFGACTPLPSSR